MTAAETKSASTPVEVAASGFNLEDSKRRAARSIESLLGPEGDALAVAIERTKSIAEFTARAERTRDIISQMRGASRAKDFWAATGLQA